MSGVTTVSKDVSKRLYAWEMIRDVLNGAESVKKKGDKYLPRPNPSDISKENKDRYAFYKERAVFYNFTGRTHHGMVGQVFGKPTKLNLPDQLTEFTANIDGAGVGIEQQLKQAVGLVLAYGRAGLYVDYTSTGDATVIDVEEGRARPVIRLYEPFDIINYRVDVNGAALMIVLREYYEARSADDEFELSQEVQYRVLRLHTSGCTSQIYRGDNGEFAAVEGEQYLADANGELLKSLPFCVIGSENNDMYTDVPPLYDLAELNIAHYRNSADYEESAYMCGQPTPYVVGVTQQWVNDVFKGDIRLGSRSVIPLPVGGAAGLLQPSSNSMPKDAMEHKERQAAALGAKLVEKKTVERTATEVQADEAASISILGSIAKNVEAAYKSAFTIFGNFLGVTVTDDAIVMNTDFDISRMSAGERQQLLLEWQAGIIAFSEYREVLHQAGVAKLDNEAAKAEIKTTQPVKETQ